MKKNRVHPKSRDVLSKISFTNKIKIVLVIFIVILFLFSLFLGISEYKKNYTQEELVLKKLHENKQIILSSYKQYMVGEPFVNKLNNSEEYVIIYPSLRIVYDYHNDEVKQIMFISNLK